MRFIPAVSPVQIQVPLPDSMKRREALHGIPNGPLVKWLRHGPFTAVTWVRIPYGSPSHKTSWYCGVLWAQKQGGLAQLVRAPASHAGGHWFESSSLHQEESLEPQGFEDFSFPRTRKYWAAGLAVICGKIRPFSCLCCKSVANFSCPSILCAAMDWGIFLCPQEITYFSSRTVTFAKMSIVANLQQLNKIRRFSKRSVPSQQSGPPGSGGHSGYRHARSYPPCCVPPNTALP